LTATIDLSSVDRRPTINGRAFDSLASRNQAKMKAQVITGSKTDRGRFGANRRDIADVIVLVKAPIDSAFPATVEECARK